MKNTFNRIGKIISSAVFVLLMIIVGFMIFYIVRVKFLANNDRLGDIKINFYTILTTSMVPTIDAGDVVITYANDNGSYNKGDIITFIRDGSVTITHRVMEVSMLNNEYYYTTKGDHNPSNDTTPVASSNVIGRVIFRIPKLGYLQQFLVSKVGWITIIVLPCLGIVIYDIMKLLKSIYGKSKKTIKENEKTILARENLKKVIANE